MLNKEDMTNSVCLLSSSPSTEKKSSKYDDHIKHKSLVPNFHMAWATLEKAVTEDTEPKGKTFFGKFWDFWFRGSTQLDKHRFVVIYGLTFFFCLTPNLRVTVALSGKSSGLTVCTRNPLLTSFMVAPDEPTDCSIPARPKSATLRRSSQDMAAGLTFRLKTLDSGHPSKIESCR
jgi:hypothetical protein